MDGKEIINEISEYLNDDVNLTAADDDALPFESLDDYSSDPVGFGEMVKMMMDKVDFLYQEAGKYNRHSAQYLKLCAQLERGIKYLGSCCLTKHAMELNDREALPGLGQLSTTKLYAMASRHFRKLDRALSEHIAQKHETDPALLKMQFTYFNLLNRLRKTEAKIEKYHGDYYYNSEHRDYSPIVAGKAFSEKSWSKRIHEHEEAPAFRDFSSLPMLPISKSEIRNQKSDENEEVRNKNEEDGTNQKSEIRNQKSDENEEVVPADVQESENGYEASVSDDQLSTSHREQFSKKGSTRRVAEEIAENEEDGENQKSEIRNQKSDENEDGRMKNEEMAAENEEVILPAEEEVPQCVRILQNAMIRSRLHNLDYIGFTEGEMRLLTADPLFAQLQPQMAADMKQALLEHDSG